jgi:hypothetical protein
MDCYIAAYSAGGRSFANHAIKIQRAHKLRMIMIVLLISGWVGWRADDAYADSGVGVGVGDISGLSFFHRLDRKTFVQGLVSMDDFFDAYVVTGDYAFSVYGVLREFPRIEMFYGYGGIIFRYKDWVNIPTALARSSDLGLGVRIPVGVRYKLPRMPIQFGVEIDPGVVVTPVMTVFVDVLFTVRVLFY